MSKWLEAFLWGLLAGGALIIGALGGYYLNMSKKMIALIMAFSSGVLISALAFELMDEAYKRGGFISTAIGFLGGALVCSLIDFYLASKGAKRRKCSHEKQPSEEEDKGSGITIALGAILAILIDTMISEAFEEVHNWAGLITVAGFLASFILSKIGG